jgi:hypothetical protein
MGWSASTTVRMSKRCSQVRHSAQRDVDALCETVLESDGAQNKVQSENQQQPVRSN